MINASGDNTKMFASAVKQFCLTFRGFCVMDSVVVVVVHQLNHDLPGGMVFLGHFSEFLFLFFMTKRKGKIEDTNKKI